MSVLYRQMSRAQGEAAFAEFLAERPVALQRLRDALAGDGIDPEGVVGRQCGQPHSGVGVAACPAHWQGRCPFSAGGGAADLVAVFPAGGVDPVGGEQPDEFTHEVSIDDDLIVELPRVVASLAKALAKEPGIEQAWRADREVLHVTAPSWTTDQLQTWALAHIRKRL